MQIPRWAAVAVLAPIGFLLIHSSIVSHSSLAERVHDTATLPAVLSNDWAKGKFANFSPGELHELAERCELRWRLPPFSGGQDLAFADDEERAIYGDVLAGEEARYTDALHALHHELTGDDGPTALSALRDSLRMNPDADTSDVHRALSAQRAGDVAPAPSSVYARYLAGELASGDKLEAALTARLGPDRARALREAAGPRHTLTGCDDEHAMYRSER
jgi:hypothetical protein